MIANNHDNPRIYVCSSCVVFENVFCVHYNLLMICCFDFLLIMYSFVFVSVIVLSAL